MLWLVVKTLLHEKVRFFITLIGITVAGVLALVEIAIYLGMMANATAVIRHTDADVWIASKNIQTFDFALPFPAGRINQVRALRYSPLRSTARARWLSRSPSWRGRAHWRAWWRWWPKRRPRNPPPRDSPTASSGFLCRPCW